MAGTEVTEAPVADPEVTPTEVVAGEPDATAQAIQDSAAKLQEYEQQFKELSDRLEREAQARSEAETNVAKATELAKSEEKIRKGIQRESQNKLNELARLKEQIANQTITSARLEKMEKLVNKLAEVQLDPETVKNLNDEIDKEQMRRENEQLKAADLQRQQRPALTPDYKRQLVEAYFPGEFTDIDVLDLRDSDWLNGATTEEEWKDKIRAGFNRVRASRQPVAPAIDIEELTKRITEQVSTQFNSTRSQDQEALSNATAKMKLLEEQLEEQKRVAEEALNRSKGMDRGSDSPAHVAVTERQALPDDSALYGSKEEKADYHKQMNDKNLRNDILKRAGLM